MSLLLDSSGLRVQYRCDTTNPAANQIGMKLRVVNAGGDAVPLGELTVRYWYTADGPPCSAEWHSAVSRIGNPQGLRGYKRIANAWHCRLPVGETAE